MCRLFGLHAGGEDVDATFWLLDAPVSIAERGNQPLDEHSPHGTIRMRARAGSRRPLIVVASEPMDEDLEWEEIASGELVHIGPELELHREVILHEPPSKPLSLTGRAAVSQAQEK